MALKYPTAQASKLSMKYLIAYIKEVLPLFMISISLSQSIDIADKIYNGLINGSSFEIDFPKELTLILKFLKILPDSLYFKIIKKLTKYQKR